MKFKPGHLIRSTWLSKGGARAYGALGLILKLEPFLMDFNNKTLKGEWVDGADVLWMLNDGRTFRNGIPLSQLVLIEGPE